MVAKRKKMNRGMVAAMATLCCTFLLALGCWGFSFASAGLTNVDDDTFGIGNLSTSFDADSLNASDEESSETQSITEDIFDTPQEASMLTTTVKRDVSNGLRQLEEEEQARIRAEEEARIAAEKVFIDQAAANRAKYVSSFGSLPLEDVDWSIGKDAFISTWTDRINAYLKGSELAGYGEVFAKVAWEKGIDPRWSPAISNTESTKGKHCFKYHNAWGWGQSSWSSWDQAITAHVTGLSEVYGYTISTTYAQRYCPTDGDWYAKTLAEMRTI